MVMAIVITTVAKIIYATLTPWSHDFINYTTLGAQAIQGSISSFGIYTGSALLFALSYLLWVAVTHNPQLVFDIYHHFMTGFWGGPPGSIVHVDANVFLFSFILKVPFILADIIITVLIVMLTRRLTGSPSSGLRAGVFWAISPLCFLLENWGPVDVMAALFILAGTYAFYKRRSISAGVLLAIGALMRLAPLFLLPLLIVAMLRNRRFLEMARFLCSFCLVLSLGPVYLVASYGAGAFMALLYQRPGILVDEVLVLIGPYISPIVTYNPYPLGLGLISYALVTAYITHPRRWGNRNFGEEALLAFAASFALTGIVGAFVLWVLPLLAIFAVTRNFGLSRYLLLNLSGFAFLVITQSQGAFASGQAVLFIPSINSTLAAVSLAMYGLGRGLAQQVILSPILRSIFGAAFLLVCIRLIRCLYSANLR